MRITIPTIPHNPSYIPKTTISPQSAIDRLAEFISPGSVAILTGAGVSVDSGIRAYRGKDGRYVNPNYKPILYHEIIDPTLKGHSFRQRYWLRSYLGYPPIRDSIPNPTHFSLAALQYTNHVKNLITQNVDGLHGKALRSVKELKGKDQFKDESEESLLELHGTLHQVSCTNGHIINRNTFQSWLSTSNPKWVYYTTELEKKGQKIRTNPDGDVVLEGVSYDDFVIPDCPACLNQNIRNNIHKPDLIFFGESISAEVKQRSFQDIETCDRLLIIGTTLATFSAFRLLRHAIDLHKPILMLNLGPTRADDILPNIEKIEIPVGTVIKDVVRAVLGSRANSDPIVASMLVSGVVKPPAEGDNDTIPSPAGQS